VAISEQYREIMPAIDQGGTVRLTTPFFNIYGLITLVGGALWSAWLFLRKRVLPNRVLGNVLIAAGALSIGAASTLTRMGYGQLLYLGELFAAVLMYVGFVMAGKPSTVEEPQAALAASGD
jgi:drug/metabolite transporter (DMT)-like permease